MSSQDSDPEFFDPAYLPPNVLNAVEADSFWCLSRLLDGIQDNYIHGQPGIHRGVKRIAELVARIDGVFHRPRSGERGLTSNKISSSGGTSGVGERRVHAICLQVDELFADERDKRAKYHSDVGYIPCKPMLLCQTYADPDPTCGRVKERRHSRSFTSMCVLHSW